MLNNCNFLLNISFHIRKRFPYTVLNRQCRMLEKFTMLLKPIYPLLETNHEAVAKNIETQCVSNSLFFWEHKYATITIAIEHPINFFWIKKLSNFICYNNSNCKLRHPEDFQTYSQSHSNTTEAYMAIRLAKWIETVEPNQKITILAAYTQQVCFKKAKNRK